MPFAHNINPVFLDLGIVQIRYYGIIFALGFLAAYFWLRHESKKKRLSLSFDDIDELFLYIIPAVVIGARIFEIIFYEPAYYLANPAQMIAVWNGGLSFHGGLAGAGVALALFLKKHKGLSFYSLADALVVPAAFALFLGRIANFINGELWGTVTNVSWCVYFPGVEGCRHPSQLYESAKNLLIFFALLAIRNVHLTKSGAKNSRAGEGRLFWWFVLMYGTLRFAANFFRDDPSVLLGISMGQLLSLVMAIAAAAMLWRMRNSEARAAKARND